MTTPQPNKTTFPFPPALMAIDFAALIAVGLCVAELFPENGKPLGLIPNNLLWPVLLISVVVAAICGFMQVRILLGRNKPACAEVEQTNLK